MADIEFNRAKRAQAAPKAEPKAEPKAGPTSEPQAETQAEAPVKRTRRRMTFREATQRTKLDVRISDADKERFAYRWVNNDPGRLQMMQDRGYEIVDDPYLDDERGAERRVGRNEDGSKMSARLMRIPREWRDEDEAEKRAMRQERIDSVIREKGLDSEAKREGIRAEQMSVTT